VTLANIFNETRQTDNLNLYFQQFFAVSSALVLPPLPYQGNKNQRRPWPAIKKILKMLFLPYDIILNATWFCQLLDKIKKIVRINLFLLTK